MNDPFKTEEEVICPSIVFRVRGGLYSINSQHVASIMQMPEYEALPDAPPNIIGVFHFQNEVVPLMDLRTLFGMPSLQYEYQAFCHTLEQRKNDHIHWVNELERCMQNGEAFTLATDPHQCAFGKWYDNYRSDNNTINFHLRKIEAPHQRLHRAAAEVIDCQRLCDICSRQQCLQKVMDEVKSESMPAILSLLEETKHVFKTAYHEMLLVLEHESKLGLIIDEVLSVEDLSDSFGQSALNQFHCSDCILGVKTSSSISGLILELDSLKLLENTIAFSQ